MNSMYENCDVHDIRNVWFCSMHKQWIWKEIENKSCKQDLSIELGLNISLKYNYTYNTMRKIAISC